MKQLTLLLLFTGLVSCSKKENLQPDQKTHDTIVAKNISKSEYYSEIISYHLVIAGDSSKTGITFFKNEEGKLHLGLGFGIGSHKRNYKETKPYRLRYLEIEKLMKYAAQDLDTKSLKDVGIGFLI